MNELPPEHFINERAPVRLCWQIPLL